MKLSEMSSDVAADVFLRITPDIEHLIVDEGLADILKDRKPPKDKKDADKLGKTGMLKIVSYLLKNKRENVWNIIGALNNMTPAEVGEQNIIKTTADLCNILMDKDFLQLFIQLAKLGQEL